MSNNLICFGDVVKLSAKSAFADATGDNDGTNFLGFLEQKKEMLLVVAPVKDELKDKFLEAEFVISAVRGDKAPLPGTPLNYKQPFVLKTSDGSGYSLNNKTPGASEVVSLREASIKGEMYVAVEKEGFGAETHVHDSDTNVELHVVDSNRIRKNYDNVALRHFTKPKSDAPGGFVTCAAKKGTVLSFKIVKVADKTETRAFIKDPVMRRASQLLLQDPKADETSEASVLESPSRAGSIVTTGPLVATSAPASPTAAGAAAAAADHKDETPETADIAETPVPATVTTATTTVETMPAASAMGVDAAALTAQLQTVVAAHEATPMATTTTTAVETPATETPAPTTAVVAIAPPAVSEQLHSALATIELSAAFVSSHTDGVDGSVPVHDKLATPTHHTPTTVTTTTATTSTAATASTVEHSELDDTLAGLPSVPEEHLETACAGKCAIM